MTADLVLAEILTNYMDLPANRVLIYNQNWPKPKDSEVYVVISLESSDIIGISHDFDPSTEEEISNASVAETFSVEVISRSAEARNKYHEVALALRSAGALDLAGKNNIRLHRTLTITDLSSVDGAAALYRFKIGVIIHSAKTKTKSVPIYDNFEEAEITQEA